MDDQRLPAADEPQGPKRQKTTHRYEHWEYWKPVFQEFMSADAEFDKTETLSRPTQLTEALLDACAKALGVPLHTSTEKAIGGSFKCSNPDEKWFPMRSVSIDISSAYATAAQNLDPEASTAHSVVRRITSFWNTLRDKAERDKRTNDREGYKLAVNTFIGTLKHLRLPHIRNDIVNAVNQSITDTSRLLETLGMRVIVTNSDSVIFTHGHGGVPVTDEHIEAVIQACNAQGIFTYRVEHDAECMLIIHTNFQIGMDKHGDLVNQRGLIHKTDTLQMKQYVLDYAKRTITRALPPDCPHITVFQELCNSLPNLSQDMVLTDTNDRQRTAMKTRIRQIDDAVHTVTSISHIDARQITSSRTKPRTQGVVRQELALTRHCGDAQYVVSGTTQLCIINAFQSKPPTPVMHRLYRVMKNTKCMHVITADDTALDPADRMHLHAILYRIDQRHGILTRDSKGLMTPLILDFDGKAATPVCDDELIQLRLSIIKLVRIVCDCMWLESNPSNGERSPFGNPDTSAVHISDACGDDNGTFKLSFHVVVRVTGFTTYNIDQSRALARRLNTMISELKHGGDEGCEEARGAIAHILKLQMSTEHGNLFDEQVYENRSLRMVGSFHPSGTRELCPVDEQTGIVSCSLWNMEPVKRDLLIKQHSLFDSDMNARELVLEPTSYGPRPITRQNRQYGTVRYNVKDMNLAIGSQLRRLIVMVLRCQPDVPKGMGVCECKNVKYCHSPGAALHLTLKTTFCPWRQQRQCAERGPKHNTRHLTLEIPAVGQDDDDACTKPWRLKCFSIECAKLCDKVSSGKLAMECVDIPNSATRAVWKAIHT